MSERTSIHDILLPRVTQKNNLYNKEPKRTLPQMKRRLPALPQLPRTQLAHNILTCNVNTTWQNEVTYNQKNHTILPQVAHSVLCEKTASTASNIRSCTSAAASICSISHADLTSL